MKLKLIISTSPEQDVHFPENLSNSADLANEYLNYLRRKGRAYGTIRLHAFMLLHLCRFQERIETPLQDFNENDFVDFLLFINTANPERIIIRTRILGVVSLFFRFLEQYDTVYKNPAQNLRHVLNSHKNELQCIPGSSMKRKTISDSDFKTLIYAAKNPADIILLCLLRETGMRISEALSLRLQDIDIFEKRIHIANHTVTGTKTPAGIRTIDCSEFLINLTSSYVNSCICTDSGLNTLFQKKRRNGNYSPMTYDDVYNLFRSLRRRTGIRVTPHMLRHTSLTKLYYSGWPIEMLRVRAGHKSASTTAGCYIHTGEEELIEAFNAFIRKTNENGDLTYALHKH